MRSEQAPYDMQQQSKMHLRKCVIGPSILSADFAFLFKECQEMIEIGATSLHIDIMDGHFVPNLTIGPPVVACLRKHLPHVHFDCHLMVTYPRHYIEPIAKAGGNCFIFHYESSYGDLKDICSSIRSHKMQVGLSVKPKTPIDSVIQELITEKLVDKILVMTVQPGFGGQKFMPQTMEKVRYLHQKYPQLDIQVDGGIDASNAEQVSKDGANYLIVGSALFYAKNRPQTFKSIYQSSLKGLSTSS